MTRVSCQLLLASPRERNTELVLKSGEGVGEDEEEPEEKSWVGGGG